MSLSGGLTFEFTDGREPVRLRFAVSTEEEAVLRAFSRSVRELTESLRNVGGLPFHLNLTYREGRLAFTTTEPTDDQRAVILHRLRPLILTREPGSFDRVCGIVRRSSQHEFLGEHLRGVRDLYSGAVLRDLVVVSRGDVVLNSERAFDHWLNGFEYHQEAERRAFIAEEGDLLPLEAVRPIFLAMLVEKLKAIIRLASVVDKMLERPAEQA